MISAEQLDACRKDFEISLLFNNYHLLSGQGGDCIRNADGTYKNMFIEAAWRGYQMSISHAEGMLERFDPMRYISNGLIGAFKEASSYDYIESDEIEIHDMIRAVLTATKGTPV